MLLKLFLHVRYFLFVYHNVTSPILYQVADEFADEDDELLVSLAGNAFSAFALGPVLIGALANMEWEDLVAVVDSD